MESTFLVLPILTAGIACFMRHTVYATGISERHERMMDMAALFMIWAAIVHAYIFIVLRTPQRTIIATLAILLAAILPLWVPLLRRNVLMVGIALAILTLSVVIHSPDIVAGTAMATILAYATRCLATYRRTTCRNHACTPRIWVVYTIGATYICGTLLVFGMWAFLSAILADARGDAAGAGILFICALVATVLWMFFTQWCCLSMTEVSCVRANETTTPHVPKYLPADKRTHEKRFPIPPRAPEQSTKDEVDLFAKIQAAAKRCNPPCALVFLCFGAIYMGFLLMFLARESPAAAAMQGVLFCVFAILLCPKRTSENEATYTLESGMRATAAYVMFGPFEGPKNPDELRLFFWTILGLMATSLITLLPVHLLGKTYATALTLAPLTLLMTYMARTVSTYVRHLPHQLWLALLGIAVLHILITLSQ